MCAGLLLACVSLVAWCGCVGAAGTRRVHGGEAVTSRRGSGHAGLLLLTCRYPAETRAWTCGASGLQPRLVLTAAHCLDNCPDIASTRVFVGDLVAFEGNAIEIQRFIGHSRHSAKRVFAYDIAVGLTTTDIKIGNYAEVATISKQYMEFMRGHVFGWGVKAIDGESKYVMKKLQVPFISTKRCNYIFETTIPDGTFCAGSDTHNYVSFGDSGCGLVVGGGATRLAGLVGGGATRLAGLVAGGYPSARVAPALYTNVTWHYSWLRAVATALLKRL